jgi:hypothetical protein
VSFPASVSSFVVESAFRELLRDGGARKTEAVGPKLSDSGDRIEPDAATVGLVPARFLDVVSCEGVCVVTIKGAFRSCAAENEGRKRRRAAIDPLTSGSEARSSPFTDGPEETRVLPTGAPGEGEETPDSVVLTSVDPLPLRFRRRYASIALASCSRTRDAIGDSADAGLEIDDKSALLEYENTGVGEAENVLALPDEEAPERNVF